MYRLMDNRAIRFIPHLLDLRSTKLINKLTNMKIDLHKIPIREVELQVPSLQWVFEKLL